MRFRFDVSTLHAVVVLLAGLSLACTGNLKTDGPPGASPALDTSPPWAHFIDTGDTGDDPWTPGCHYKCSDPTCEGERQFWGGDSCTGGELQEWTASEPHAAASDVVRHDCAAECKAKGSLGGRCARVENACDGSAPSSRCECE